MASTSGSSRSITSTSTSSQSDCEKVKPYILAGLKHSERCQVDRLLSSLLRRCQEINPPASLPTQHNLQPIGDSKNLVLSSAATGEPEEISSGVSTDAPALDPDVDPDSHKLLQSIVDICNDTEMQEYIAEYQEKKLAKSRCLPFARLANRALELLKSPQLPQLRPASASDILFVANHGTHIIGKGGSELEPNVVVVPLASAKRARQNFQADWTNYAEGSWSSDHRAPFEWPDVLLSGEVGWYLRTLKVQRPATYEATPKRDINWLPTQWEDTSAFHALQASLSPPKSNATSPVLSLPTSSCSTHNLAPIDAGVENDTGGTDRDRKRHIDPDDNYQQSKRSRLGDDTQRFNEYILSMVSRLGTNATEMLRCSNGRTHALGFVIIDAILWIWWFDRQGAIQSTGISLIEDLPRFLVFLCCLQRFDTADWGFNAALDPSIPVRHFTDVAPTPQPVQLQVDGKDGKFMVGFTSDIDQRLHDPVCLKGKSTVVFDVNRIPGQPLVAKLYWPNYNRPHEVDVIYRAREVANLANHLPEVIGQLEIDPIGTGRIRDDLGISASSPRPWRVCRIVIFEKLYPIIQLPGDDLIFAWVECIRCHYLAWQAGIRHLDLSLSNIMYRKRDGCIQYGVVNDWDLGDWDPNRTESFQNLTKTVQFTSLELLERKPEGAQVLQHYHQDLESFLWILIWVFTAVEDGRIRPTQELVGWQTGDPIISHGKRSSFLINPSYYKSGEEWKPYSGILKAFRKWLHSFQEARVQACEANQSLVEDRELLRSVLVALKTHYKGPMPISPPIPDLD